MTTKGQPSPASDSTWAPTFLAILVLTPLALFLVIGLGAKSPGALLLYINPGSPYEAGLRRRRAAEGALWNS